VGGRPPFRPLSRLRPPAHGERRENRSHTNPQVTAFDAGLGCPGMTDDYPYVARQRVDALIDSLETLIRRDPEQEVQGFAVPVLAAALEDIKAARIEDPVVVSLVDLMSADFIGIGEPIRAADMLVVAKQLDAAIGPAPPPGVA
jgi:hypothetical protein